MPSIGATSMARTLSSMRPESGRLHRFDTRSFHGSESLLNELAEVFEILRRMPANHLRSTTEQEELIYQLTERIATFTDRRASSSEDEPSVNPFAPSIMELRDPFANRHVTMGGLSPEEVMDGTEVTRRVSPGDTYRTRYGGIELSDGAGAVTASTPF